MHHLHVHSTYSRMEGVSSPHDLVDAAVEMGYRTLALTDTNGLYGMVFFLQAAKEAGIAPIVGCEIVHGLHRAVLLVKNAAGYSNLCRIISARHCDPDFDTAAAIAEHRDGLIAITDDALVLSKLARSDREDLYVELSPGYLAHAAYALARDMDLPPVATSRVRFVGSGDYWLHRLLRAIDLNTRLSRLRPEDVCTERSYMTSPAEIADLFPHAPHAIENTARVAEACKRDWDFRETIFPAYKTLNDDEAYRLLRRKTFEGAKRRYGDVLRPDVVARIEHELAVIRAKRFIHYFLIVEDIVKESSLTCGRGSGAASIVSYALRITDVDPIRHNLFFERFLNPGRVDPPDIDVDFAWDERDRIIDYVFAKFGTRRCAMVANHPSLQARAAIREVAKVYGMPDAEIGRITSRLARLWYEDAPIEAIHRHPLFKDIQLPRPWPEILDAARRLGGNFRHISLHCGGVVVVPDEIRAYAPVEIAPKGLQVIQWEKDQTEDAGLVKIDLLGNRSLAVIRDAVAAVRRNRNGRSTLIPRQASNAMTAQACEKGPGARRQGARSGAYALVREHRSDAGDEADGSLSPDLGRSSHDDELSPARWRPADDPATCEIIRRGETMGCFYIESPATRLLLQKMWGGNRFPGREEKDVFEHVVMASSIIRPAANQFAQEFVRRMHGEKWEHIHPLLKPVLDETYGVMIYQEQVTQIAMAMAGFSAYDGDQLRKILTKKHRERKLRDYYEQFLQGARERGVPSAVVRDVWQQILSFSGYSFCKPHSASYAMVSFKSAYLRAHHPAEFMAAVISNQGGYYSSFAYISEARRLGLAVLPPDVNASGIAYAGETNHADDGRSGWLRVGLMQLKSLNAASAETVVSERERNGRFRSFDDFVARTRVPPSDVKILIKAGAMDCFAMTRPAMMWRLYDLTGSIASQPRQRELFDEETSDAELQLKTASPSAPLESADDDRGIPNYDAKTLLRHEIETLGFLISRHPLDLYRDILRRVPFVRAAEMHRYVGRRITMIGWLVTSKLVHTKNGEPMEFVSFEDTTALYETVFFPEAYRRFCHILSHVKPYILRGRVDVEENACTLTVDWVGLLDELEFRNNREPARRVEAPRAAEALIDLKERGA